MSQVAKDLLASSYGVRGAKVRIIPHGIPEMDAAAIKTRSRRSSAWPSAACC